MVLPISFFLKELCGWEMTVLVCHQHLITNSVQQLLIRHTVKCKFMPHALSRASSCTEHVSSPLAPPTHNRTSSTTSTSPQRCWLGSGLSWTALPSAVLSFGKLEKERDFVNLWGGEESYQHFNLIPEPNKCPCSLLKTFIFKHCPEFSHLQLLPWLVHPKTV